MYRDLKAPGLADIEAMAHAIFADLPSHFRALCQDLVIHVTDFAEAEDLEHFGCDSEFEILGLFKGVGLPHQSHTDVPRLPNMVWLYRRPILDYWAEHDDSLEEIVRHVLVHEIGHHFGLSDRDMTAIEHRPDPPCSD